MRHGLISRFALVLLVLFAPVIHASALFEGTNANLWLVDEKGEQLTGYTAGEWLSQFMVDGTEVYNLEPGQQALVNEIPNSSLPLTAGQPWISLSGLGEADYNIGSPSGQPMLKISPQSGSFNETVTVEIFVATEEVEKQSVTLTWQVDSAPEQSRRLTQETLEAAGADIQNGYWRHRFHLVRDNTYSISARLNDDGGVLLDSVSAGFTLATDHADGFRRDADGDGLPDLVEAAIDLDPFSEDWRHDSDDDGWSDFDIWLRDGGIYSLNADGKPLDSDNDGWSDFDEDLRGTNPNESVTLTLEGNETEDSASYQERRRRYMDFPAATRLYEVEHQVDGQLAPETLTDTVVWRQVLATKLHGAVLYDRNRLISGDELTDAGLAADDLAERRLANPAKSRLETGFLPLMRLPAGGERIIMAEQRFAGSDAKDAYSQVYKAWLPKRSDLSPWSFLNVEGVGTWNTVDEWKAAFVLYLENQLVQPMAPVLDSQSTTNLAILEAGISQEARLRGRATPQLFANADHPLDRLVLDALEQSMRQRSDSGYGWQKLYDQVAGHQGAGQLLESLAKDIGGQLASPQAGLRSDRAIVDNYITPDAVDGLYRSRLLFLPEADSELADTGLHQPDADSDSDGKTNLAELDAPLHRVSLPWLSDSDDDGMADGRDACPVDSLNGCDGNADLPQVTVTATVTVNEPGAGAGVALLTLTLNRAVDEPVRVYYKTLAFDEDSAEVDIDFDAVEDSVVIPAGSRVVVVPLPVLPDAETESAETFHLSISQIDNAGLDGGADIEVTIQDTPATAPDAIVAETTLVVPERSTALLDASPSVDPAGFELGFAWSQSSDSTDGISLNNIDQALADFVAPELPDLSTKVLSFDVVVNNEVNLTDTEIVTVTIEPIDDPPEVKYTPLFNALQGNHLPISDADLTEAVFERDGQLLHVDSIQLYPQGRLGRTDTGLSYYAPRGERQLTTVETQDLYPVNDDFMVYVETPKLRTGDPNRVVAYRPADDTRKVLLELVADTGGGFVGAPGQDLVYFHHAEANELYRWRPGGTLNRTGFTLPFQRSAVDTTNGDLYTCDATGTESWMRTDQSTLVTENTGLGCENVDTVLGATLKERFCVAQATQLSCTNGVGGLDPVAGFEVGTQIQRLVEADGRLLVFASNVPTDGDFDDFETWLVAPDNSKRLLHRFSSNTNYVPAVQALDDGSYLFMHAQHGASRLWRWSGVSSETPTLVDMTGVALINNEVGDLALHEGEVYWHHRVSSTLQELDRLDPGTGSRTLVDSHGADAATPARLLQAHNNLHFFTPSSMSGTCNLQRLDLTSGSATVLADVDCTSALTLNENIAFSRLDSDGLNAWVYDGNQFSGQTEFFVLVSDETGNSVELPVEIDVEAR